jgi:L-amino acid N-acyltransferase YncA
MHVRLALPADTAELIEMARANVAHTRPTLAFSEDRCRETMAGYLANASPTIYVAEDAGGLVGFLMCDFFPYPAATGLYAAQQVLFVKPEKRGTRAATLLTRQLIEWAEIIGAQEIVGGNDNEFNSERTARFLEHFGFRRVGIAMRRVI